MLCATTYIRLLQSNMHSPNPEQGAVFNWCSIRKSHCISKAFISNELPTCLLDNLRLAFIKVIDYTHNINKRPFLFSPIQAFILK
mgnify:CR=1 FL=1